MKVSELIKELEDIKRNYGNLDVVINFEDIENVENEVFVDIWKNENKIKCQIQNYPY